MYLARDTSVAEKVPLRGPAAGVRTDSRRPHGKVGVPKENRRGEFSRADPGREAPGEQPAGADVPDQAGLRDHLLRPHDLIWPAVATNLPAARARRRTARSGARA